MAFFAWWAGEPGEQRGRIVRRIGGAAADAYEK